MVICTWTVVTLEIVINNVSIMSVKNPIGVAAIMSDSHAVGALVVHIKVATE